MELDEVKKEKSGYGEELRRIIYNRLCTTKWTLYISCGKKTSNKLNTFNFLVLIMGLNSKKVIICEQISSYY